MILARNLLTAAVLLGGAAPLFAADAVRCLSPEERRARIAAHAIIPLTKAIKVAKVTRREVVRASLCEQNGRLVYVLTVLGRDGRVTRLVVDAGSGTVLAGH